MYHHSSLDLEIEDEHFYNHPYYKGKISEHPGNESLPEDITGKKPNVT